MRLSDVVADYLVKIGVSVVFGYQGGAITHMIDSFDRYGIKYIQSYNEQGAGLAADAYTRVSSLGLGVAIATNGPGATNLITAIANAYCDSVPVLFFTGQVHTYAMKKNKNIRQESFQEIDIISMVKNITKYATTILDPQNVIQEISKAINIALNGRKGPVLIDIPVDVQNMDMDIDIRQYMNICKTKRDIKTEDCEVYFNEIWKTLKRVKQPLMIVGGGIRNSYACDLFRSLIEKVHIPVVCSLMGLDVLPHDNTNFEGFIGTYGNRYANMAIQEADFILVLGSRLDMRQTGKNKELFAPKATIYHVDIDQLELKHYLNKENGILADVNSCIEYMLNRVNEINDEQWGPWCQKIENWKEKYSDDLEFNTSIELNPNLMIKEIGKLIPDNSVITCDVGQNQIWMAQSLRVKGMNIRILNSGGLGTMGYSLPAAIGAYYADSSKNIMAFMGDGGLQMNIQELQVISNYSLPIKVIVLKNNALGLIRDVHEKYYNRRYVGSVIGFSVPPLDKLASTYNMHYIKVSEYEEILNLKSIVNSSEGYLVEVEMNGDTYTRPELLGLNSLDKQSPYIDEVDG